MGQACLTAFHLQAPALMRSLQIPALISAGPRGIVGGMGFQCRKSPNSRSSASGAASVVAAAGLP